jgi:hypothetical protein
MRPGYMLAAAVLHGSRNAPRRNADSKPARRSPMPAQALLDGPQAQHTAPFVPPPTLNGRCALEETDFGPARRLTPPVTVDGTPLRLGPAGRAARQLAPAWSA